MTDSAMCRGTLPRFQEPLQPLTQAGWADNIRGDALLPEIYRMQCKDVREANTYDYDRANEHSVHEEIARLREARRLTLESAAVLV
jgi:hypothetical protein